MGAGFIDARGLDTVQADPIAVLRAAVRDFADRTGERQSGDGRDPQRPREPKERRAPMLLSHGITVFRKKAKNS